MKNFLLFLVKKKIAAINFFILLFKNKKIELSDIKELNEIREKSLILTDINEHLETIYNETVKAQPKLIVELGVRGGESTFVFERAALISESNLLSVDIEDIDFKSDYEKWQFYRGDDIELGKNFTKFAKENNLPEKIDVLFIDTSHQYKHTVDEINTWFKHLSDNGIVLFHDTFISTIFRRKDGTIGGGWNNKRGVIRAIEEYLKTKFDEKQPFVTTVKGFEITHHPYCNGLTILKKKK